MLYRMTTVINDALVAIECDGWTARVLLPVWVKAEPNYTSCQELSGERHLIACFMDEPDYSHKEPEFSAHERHLVYNLHADDM